MDSKAMEVGYELPPVMKSIVFEQVFNYSARHGGIFLKYIHTDRSVAKKYGFPDIVLAGSQVLNYANELLFKVYREHWIKSSNIKGIFVKSVFPGDVLTLKGIIKGKNIEGIKTKLEIEIWSENKVGEKTMVGEATVTIAEG